MNMNTTNNAIKIYELPCLDTKKSFYGKAKVIESENVIQLYSYDTLVAQITDGVYEDVYYEHHSMTTNRHIKSFKQFFNVA